MFVVFLLGFINLPGASAAEPDVPVALAKTITQAVTGWGEFAAAGNLESVAPWFAEDGPQWHQFADEVAQTPPRQLLRFDIRELQPRHIGTDEATVWTRVTVSGDGLVAETFGWDFTLIHRDGQWLVWTVTTASRPQLTQPSTTASRPATTAAPAPPSTTLAAPTTTTTLRTSVTDPDERAGVVAETATGSDAVPVAAGVRLSRLWAWIIVATVVLVIAAGYLAPRLETQRSQR